MNKNDLVANMTRAMGGSGKNRPQLPKGEGRGRVDDTHQVAVLTDLEAHALNTLRWKDKDRGFSSGSGPEIKALAAQNTRPFDFVEYKGDKIPTLNDSSDDNLTGSTDSSGNTTYSYGGDSDSSGGGYKESAWAKKKRLEAEARARAEAEAREAAAAQARWEEEQRKAEERQREIKDINQYIALQRKKRLEFYNENHDLSGGIHESTEDEDALTDPDILDISTEEEDLFNDPDILEGDDDEGGLTEDEFNELVEKYDLKPEFQAKDGEMYWTQEEADMVNARFDTARDTALGTLDTYGTETYGTDYMSGLAENYTGSFADERQTAYDAALEGIYDDFKLSGVWDQTAYDEALAAVDAGVLADQGLLDTAATGYTDLAQADYDEWLAAQTKEIQDLYSGTSLEDLSDWELDVVGSDTNVGLDMSAYDPTSDNYNPDLMNLEGQDFNFLEEFKKIYPSGTTTPGVTEVTGDTDVPGGDESTGRSSVRKTKKAKSKVPTYTSSPFASGGSSSTIS